MAHRRRHGRAAGAAGAAARRRRRSAEPALARHRAPCSAGSSACCGPAVTGCGPAEIAGLLAGLDGRFVAPGPDRRAEPRPARRAADRAQFLFGRHPRGADPGGLAARLAVGRRCWSSAIAQEHGDYPARLALSAWGTANMRTGGDDIAQALALIGVPPGLGRRQRPGHRLRDPAAVGARPAARRRDAAHLRLFPRRLSRRRSTCSTARCAPSRRSTSRPSSTRSPPASRADAAALEAAGVAPDEAARRAGYRIFGSQARRLRRRPAGPDRRAHLAGRRRSRRRLSRLGRLRLWRRRRGAGRARPARSAARRDRRGPAQPGQPRARPARQRRLLPVRGRARRRGAAPVGRAARRSTTTTIRSPERPRIRTLARGDRPRSCAAAPPTRAGSPASCATATRAPPRSPRRSTTCSPSPRPRGGRRPPFRRAVRRLSADEAVRGFIAEHNPAALREIASRFREAIERGLWRPRRNSARPLLDELRAGSQTNQ